jgi:hypothetical protein
MEILIIGLIIGLTVGLSYFPRIDKRYYGFKKPNIKIDIDSIQKAIDDGRKL